jgi:hypothetical protein
VLIDCDTCTVRGQGCDDCVVTVLLGAPPGWRGSDPTVVPLTRRRAAEAAPGEVAPGERRSTGGPARAAGGTACAAAGASADTGDRAEVVGDAPGRIASGGDVTRIDTGSSAARSVVELDDVERRAVRALADFGLVPPLRHQDASSPGDRHVS